MSKFIELHHMDGETEVKVIIAVAAIESISPRDNGEPGALVDLVNGVRLEAVEMFSEIREAILRKGLLI